MSDQTVFDAALAWHLRRDTMDADDWLRFVDWLEADTTHAAAYDTISLADALRHEAPTEPRAANDNPPAPRRRWWIGAGVAAAALLAATPLLRTADAPRTIVAATPQTVGLGDGSAVALAANARLVVGGDRAVRLDGGRATFHVVHDAARPFAVQVGRWTVQDVGTVFTLTRAGGGLDIAVQEGAVVVDPQGAALSLRAGDAVSIAGDGGTMVRSAVAPGGVRTFRFSGETLGDVVRVVALALNVDVRPAPGIARQPFIGVLRLTGRPGEDMPHLAAMTGTRSINDGGTWTIAPAGAATR